MGQQMGSSVPARCCQQEAMTIPTQCVPSNGTQELDYNIVGGMGHDWHCMRAEDGPLTEVVRPSSDPIESLSYSPIRFEVSPTIDVERSQARYSNLVVQSSRARLQRRSKVWEEWLRVATAGRAIELLRGCPDDAAVPCTPKEGAPQPSATAIKKIPATYFLDRALTTITMLPVEASARHDASSPSSPRMDVETVSVEKIQVICTATDFPLFADHIVSCLDDDEKKRAVLLQYIKDEPKGHKGRVCFLEDSPQDKDRFVQALTALWLEKRTEQAPSWG